MKHKKLKYTYDVLGFCLIIFLALRESLPVVLMRTSLQKDSVIFILLSIFIYLLACFVPVMVMENMLGIHPLLFKRVKPVDAAATAAFGYLIILIAGVLNSFVLAFLKKSGMEFAAHNINIPDGFFAAVLYFIYMCVLPALLEEIFVRGLVFNVLKGWGIPFAVFVSSVIFALMHSSLHHFVLYFVCGVVLAKIYIAFDSIWPCMLLHFINNAVSFVQVSFQQNENAQSAVFFYIYIYFMAILLGYAGFKHIKNQKIKLAFSFTRIRDFGYKLRSLANSYAALCALGLLLFMSAYGSWRSLV